MPDRSPSPPAVVSDSNRIGAEEDIDEYKGLTEEEIRELVGKREAKANAQILEMVGDIPDADAKPPENVLFVCKLNPATTGEDLEIIFSRFGPILSCEVIKDQKTGDSLQYAFIEFENEDDCVSAYFKMDNVLIDDRRIHVDFSQSLAKVKGIKPRRESEEQPANPRSRNDGFVAKKKAATDNYDMVFDESPNIGQPRKSVPSSSSSRKDHRREKEKHSHHRHERRGVSRREREESPERTKKRRRREEHRSRSQSRERRDHRQHRHRDRSKSRERHRRH